MYTAWKIKMGKTKQLVLILAVNILQSKDRQAIWLLIKEFLNHMYSISVTFSKLNIWFEITEDLLPQVNIKWGYINKGSYFVFNNTINSYYWTR